MQARSLVYRTEQVQGNMETFWYIPFCQNKTLFRGTLSQAMKKTN